MSKHIIKYYPVGNGDTSLIKLKDNTTIITDCRIRKVEEGIFDVKKDLLDSLETNDDGNPFTDLFILTHTDQDHCFNFSKHFYKGAPDEYDPNKSDHEDKIIVDEIWVTTMLFTTDQTDDANYIRNEVNRRKRLYKNTDIKRNERGNRLVLIGYDENSEFDNVPTYIPGDVIESINDNKLDNFSIFIHAPFKKDLEEAQAIKDRNASSIVYQGRFYDDDSNVICKIIHSGDADHYRWKTIKEKTEKKNNEDALEWDIFLSPHHCSWSFFNDTPQKDNKIPKETSLEVLDYKLEGAKVIASCKKIENNDDNPPHYKAKEEYVDKVGKNDFYNTAEFYDDFDKPIVFEIEDTSGPKLIKSAGLFGIGISTGHKKPSRAGRQYDKL
ncbi:MAG: hypothetical protein JKX82_00255 [Oleispira sp.]|nr:hypothetical protein [Oleispira sp.]